MSNVRKQRATEQQERLQRAENASEAISAQKEQVEEQIGLVSRLLKSWRRVHEENHLAQLFRDEGRIG